MRRTSPGVLCLLLSLALAACTNRAAGPAAAVPPAPSGLQPPRAAVRPHAVPSPNGERQDEYYWLRDDTRQSREVLDYLAAENAYGQALLAHTAAAQELLFTEIVSRLEPDDSTVPYRYHGYWYYHRFEPGREYPVYARRQGTLEAPEEVLLDGNAMAQGKGFFRIGNTAVTEDGPLLACAVDEVGRNQYTIRIRDLSTGLWLPDEITGADASLAWTHDGSSLLWIEKDPQTLLGVRVRCHRVGTPAAADPVVYEETDPSFYLDVTRSRSDRLLVIYLESTLCTEVRFADAADPDLRFHVLLPRERDHLYQAEDLGDRFVIRTNWQAPNFRIVEVPVASAGDRTAWRDVVPHRQDAFVEEFATFTGYLAVGERSGGLRRIRLHAWQGGAESPIAFDEPTYAAMLGNNVAQDTDTLRLDYTSLTTPLSTYDCDMRTGGRVLRKRQRVLGTFDPSDYVSEYLHAPAADGALVPVSLVHRRGVPRNGTAPLYLYGYGSYGLSSDPWFESDVLSLLDRGFVFAIAHVRGGQELGRRWYDDGHLLHKRNTFTDFLQVTDYLVREGYAAPGRVCAIGASAGGMLMGAVANLAPEKYRAIVAQVPFVDVVTSMLDESVPLTTNEYDEWGDPRQQQYYDYMLSYSPYDNVGPKAYPPMLVTTGLWDSQVQYWEPTKWVARLRARRTDERPLVLHVNMDAGHGGQSGRFRRYRETALEYAFLLDQLGIEVRPLPGPAAAP